MRVAIEGCCHGELDAIYASIARAEKEKGFKVDLLLICGDFQALRNTHDFESLAVPAKFRALGSFHSYYSGKKVAPILTIIIGGNHEASNYMWELYHGGWLAENMYYLGTAGSVLVNGLRISGASGIYKSHDLFKGFFETVPYDHSTMRSIYHIRNYSIQKLLLLPPFEQPSSSDGLPLPYSPLTASPSPFPPSSHPSIFLSHDWPLSIASSPSSSNDVGALIRRKPFFAEEIRDNTLGSKPLLEVLRKVKPRWWFSAHLHVKFAAVWRHDVVEGGGQQAVAAAPVGGATRNPDEILLDDDEDETPILKVYSNPDEIVMDDEDEDSAPPPPPSAAAAVFKEAKIDATSDKVEAVETLEVAVDTGAADSSSTEVKTALENPDEIMLDDEDEDEEHHQHPHASTSTSTLPSSLPSRPPPPILQDTSNTEGPITKFLALDKCLPNKDYLQILEIPTPLPTSSTTPPSLTYDPAWLAITRALHPFLSLSQRQTQLPQPQQLKDLVRKEMEWITKEGLGWTEGGEGKGEGKVKIGEVQRFWRTAPSQEEGGGGAAAWYTNPQTIAFCDMLKIQNKINPFPPGFVPPPLPWLAEPTPMPASTQPLPTATPSTSTSEPTPAPAPPGEAEELEVDVLVSEEVQVEQPTTKRIGGGGLSLPPPVGGAGEGEEVVLL